MTAGKPEPPRCPRCGCVIVLLRGERPRELCYCCERQIPMPGTRRYDGREASE